MDFHLFSQACNLICEQEEFVLLSLACRDTITCPASFQIDFFESTPEGELVPSHNVLGREHQEPFSS